jgi:hypothetical protein
VPFVSPYADFITNVTNTANFNRLFSGKPSVILDTGINCDFRSLRPRVFLVVLVLDLTRRRKGERDAKGIISVVTSFMLLPSNRPPKKLGFVAVRSIAKYVIFLKSFKCGAIQNVLSMAMSKKDMVRRSSKKRAVLEELEKQAASGSGDAKKKLAKAKKKMK